MKLYKLFFWAVQFHLAIIIILSMQRDNVFFGDLLDDTAPKHRSIVEDFDVIQDNYVPHRIFNFTRSEKNRLLLFWVYIYGHNG